MMLKTNRRNTAAIKENSTAEVARLSVRIRRRNVMVSLFANPYLLVIHREINGVREQRQCSEKMKIYFGGHMDRGYYEVFRLGARVKSF